MRCDVRGWMLCGLLSGGLFGCQDQTSSTSAPPTQTAPALSQPEIKPSEEAVAARQPERAAEPEAPPVAAVRSVLQGVEDGRLEVLADFLPDSYQHDVAAIVHLIADKTPDDAWTRWKSVAEKGTELLRRKPELGAQLAGGPSVPDSEEFRARLSAALDLLSDEAAWDRSRWRTFELRPFLKDSGSALFLAWQALSPPGSALLTQTKVRLLSAEGDTAVLEFRTPVDPEPRSVEFVQIEGKWIPKSLADGWETTVRAARSQLDQMDEARFARTAEKLEQVLSPLDSTLDQMLRSSRPEELQLGVWQVQSLLLQGLRDLEGAGPPPRVEIRVAGELSETELSELLDQLVAVSDHPDAAEYVTFPIGTGTVIQLSPVQNFEDFTARLTFVTVKSQDAAVRSVDVERKPKPPEPRGRGSAASE